MFSPTLLTEQQEHCIDGLPVGHKVIKTRYGPLIVRCPDGHMLRVTADGRLVEIARVRRVESYLQLNG